MKETHKTARKRLKDATLAEYKAMIQAANLTPVQRKILELHICKGSSISKTAMELYFCESTVRKHLACAYEKIANL